MAKAEPITFKEYIQRRRRTDTPAGDSREDAGGDRNLLGVQSWDQLYGYLRTRGVLHPDIINAARQVWRGYRAYLGRR